MSGRMGSMHEPGVCVLYALWCSFLPEARSTCLNPPELLLCHCICQERGGTISDYKTHGQSSLPLIARTCFVPSSPVLFKAMPQPSSRLSPGPNFPSLLVLGACVSVYDWWQNQTGARASLKVCESGVVGDRAQSCLREEGTRGGPSGAGNPLSPPKICRSTNRQVQAACGRAVVAAAEARCCP